MRCTTASPHCTSLRPAKLLATGTITRRPVNSHLRKAAMRVTQLAEEVEVVELPPALDAAAPDASFLGASPELAGAAVSVFGSVLLSVAGAELPPLPPRKSVTYQPDPLSWKPAAVTCLENASAPKAGHTVRGASEIFCSTSLAWPQDPHL